jgi:hypothetical protein
MPSQALSRPGPVLARQRVCPGRSSNASRGYWSEFYNCLKLYMVYIVYKLNVPACGQALQRARCATMNIAATHFSYIVLI